MKREQVILGQFETRRFPDYSARTSLEFMLGPCAQDLQPDMVFVHTAADLHQDHGTITAGSPARVPRHLHLRLDVIRSSHGFFPTFLLEVQPDDVEKEDPSSGGLQDVPG